MGNIKITGTNKDRNLLFAPNGFEIGGEGKHAELATLNASTLIAKNRV